MMKEITKYLKNSNTGVVMKMRILKELPFKWEFESSFSDVNGRFIGNGLCTEGFIEISEKTFKLERRKRNKK